MPGESWEQFVDNDEIKSRWIDENSKKMGFSVTEEEKQELLHDKKKMDLYRKARAVLDKENEYKKTVDKYIKMGVTKNIDKSLERIYHVYLDTSGTPEADKKNLEFIQKISTKEGAVEETSKLIQDCYNFDVNKLFPSSPEDSIKIYEENMAIFNKMFVVKSITQAGSGALDPELTDFQTSATAVIEQASTIRTDVLRFASNYYLTIPDKFFEGPKATQNTAVAMAMAQPLAQERFEKKEPGTEKGIGNSPEKFFTEFFAKSLSITSGEIATVSKNVQTLKDRKIFTSTFLKDYKCFDKNGHFVAINDALNSQHFDDYEFVPYTEKEKAELEDHLKNPVIVVDDAFKKSNDNILKVLNYVEGERVNKASGTRSLNRIQATKEVICQLYSEKGSNREIPVLNDESKKITTLSLIKVIDEKHQGRGFFWKLFHPIQNSKEEKAVEELKNLYGKIVNHKEEKVNEEYASAVVYNKDENGKYYFEEGQEPIGLTAAAKGLKLNNQDFTKQIEKSIKEKTEEPIEINEKEQEKEQVKDIIKIEEDNLEQKLSQ